MTYGYQKHSLNPQLWQHYVQSQTTEKYFAKLFKMHQPSTIQQGNVISSADGQLLLPKKVMESRKKPGNSRSRTRSFLKKRKPTVPQMKRAKPRSQQTWNQQTRTQLTQTQLTRSQLTKIQLTRMTYLTYLTFQNMKEVGCRTSKNKKSCWLI